MAYRYQNPRTQQYQSTFVPLPLDYLSQALQSRQQAYDQNMQNIMQAEDKYAGIETAPGWTEEKNRLMDETFNNIHKSVQDKYGGDYSQATNEIMRGIVGLRKNSFWNMANQDLLDWKQKKALKDQLEATGQLEYAEGFDNVKIKDENGNYVLPKRQVYAKVDTDKMLQTDFAGRFNTTRDVNVPSDRYGQYKTKRVTGSTRGEMNEVITPQYAQEILRTNPQLVMSHPEYKNSEIFRQKLVNDAMSRMPENEVYNYDRNLGVLTAGELMQERRYQADDALARAKAIAAGKIPIDAIKPSRSFAFNADTTKFKDIQTDPQNKALYDGLVQDQLKDTPYTNIKSLQQVEDRLNILKKRTDVAHRDLFNSEEVNGVLITPPKDKTERDALMKERSVLEGLHTNLQTNFSSALGNKVQGFNIDQLSTTDPTSIEKIDKIKKNLNETFTDNTNRLKSVLSQDASTLKNAESVKVKDFYYSGKELIYNVSTVDKKGVKKDILVRHIDTEDDNLSNSVIGYLSGMVDPNGENPFASVINDYGQNKSSKMFNNHYDQFKKAHPDKTQSDYFNTLSLSAQSVYTELLKSGKIPVE